MLSQEMLKVYEVLLKNIWTLKFLHFPDNSGLIIITYLNKDFDFVFLNWSHTRQIFPPAYLLL